MRVRRIAALLGTTAVVLAALTAPAAAKPDGVHGHAAKPNAHSAAVVDASAAPATGAAAVPALPDAASDVAVEHARRVCGEPAPGDAACHAHVRTRGDGVTPAATASWTAGYEPAQLLAAYGLPGANAVATVAVVDAYASPNAAADLDVYRTQFGLGTANLTQYSQTGGSIGSVPQDVGWGQEEMLDLEMVSAICPACPIIYVGANSASFADLGKAVDRAYLLGARIISNSYGAPEFRGMNTYAGPYNHPGAAITVSTGDSGYGVQAPASFGTVTAVGGTKLVMSGTTRSSETAWSGAGSGCSAYVSKPSWQHDAGCSRRTVADVSAVADPNTGVAVYDSFGSTGGNNWFVFGGTSVAAPIIAGVYALAGKTTGNLGVPAKRAYDNTSALNDITSGSNGRCTKGKNGSPYLCTGGTGYDGPTGLGTPRGTGAF